VSGLVPDIGFEIHVQLATRTKLFCSCANAVGGEPNTRVCPVCLGLPGALPVLNAAAVDLALRIAVAMGSEVGDSMRFARKNYFYPDLPKGYQITQYERPLATGGAFGDRPIRVRRVHLEEDAGKTVHGPPGSSSLVDMNRSGVPLVEIVTEPDIHDVDEADTFLKAVRRTLVFLGVTSGRLHEGSLRFDTNISVRRPASEERGTQTEIKNINSFRSVRRALGFEIERQSALLTGGGTVVHQTLLWDEALDRAVPMRSKEEESDYRYFPDPDLGPFTLPGDRVRSVRSAMPELPEAASARLRRVHGLDQDLAEVLTADPAVVACFDEAAEALEGRADAAPTLAHWIVGPVTALAHERGVEPGELVVEALAPHRLAEVVAARLDRTVTEPGARALLEAVAESDEPVDALIDRLGLAAIEDEAELEQTIRAIVAAHPDETARWKRGERKLTRYFMGLVMRETGGRADPLQAREILETALEEA